jgi:uncharacterized protein
MSRDWNLLLLDDHETTEKALIAFEQLLAGSTPPPAELCRKALDYFGTYVDQCHNLKEEKHLFPLIESRGIPRQGGPLAVMLQEHDQSRILLARLKPLLEATATGDAASLGELRAVFGEYATLLKGHFWKENDILYPMALRVMQPDDGGNVVKGIEQVEASLGTDTRVRYYRLAEEIIGGGDLKDLSFGLERDVLAAILNTLPVELSFVDAQDTVRYFSHENQDKIFPRTRGAIGTKVQDCHPQKSLDKVEQILVDFKARRSTVAEFWIDFAAKKVHIRYFAVRDATGRYLGCLEVVQDVTAIKQLQGEQRLLG